MSTWRCSRCSSRRRLEVLCSHIAAGRNAPGGAQRAVGVAADQESQADAGLVESADEISEIAFGVLETLLSTLFSCSHRRRRRRSQRAAFAGFMGSKALFAALDIELFEHIAASPGGLTTDALHARLSSESVPAMQLQTLLTALTSLGLLARDDAGPGLYTNSPGADLFLAKTNLKYDYGDYLRYQIDKQSARPAPNTSCSAAAVAEGLLCSVPIHVAPQHDHEGRGVGAEVPGL
eukprot:COSAG04_NODE_5742_length_1505_cov_2.074680_2_plen_234_part_01